MSPSQLSKIIAEAPEEVGVILAELEPRIVEAAKAVLEETQDREDAKAKVKVSLGLTIDLSMSPPSWAIDGAVGVRYTIKGEAHDTEETPELDPGMGKGRKAKSHE
jgi:hypothetical protein